MRVFGLFAIALFISAIVSCQSLVPNQPKQTALEIPQHIYPPNHASDIPVDLTFLWSDANSNHVGELHYGLYLGTSTTKMELIGSQLTDTSFQYQSLKYNTQYHWSVVVYNKSGYSSRSEIWSFRTIFENNHSPYVPSRPIPGNGATSIVLEHCSLQWKGGDPDSFSLISYDIYFGKSQDAGQLMIANYPDTSFSLSGLDFNTKYYWKIIAKDHYGATSTGPVWNFATEAATQQFTEDFDSYPTHGNPDPLKWTINKDGAWLFISDSVAYNSSGKSLCFIDTTETGNCFLATRLPARSVGILEFCWRISSEHDVLGLRMYSQNAQSDRQGPQLAIRAGQLQYYDADYIWQPVCDVRTNTWYQIRLAFDCRQKSYKIFVNQRLETERATWTGRNTPELDLIYFMTFNNRICSRGFLDQVKYLAGSRR